jgi:N,N'-diacetyllegionaminate synthase
MFDTIEKGILATMKDAYPLNSSPQPPVYIIAEAGVNHNGQLAMALQLVDAAKAAGADAVKFQWFDPHQLTAHNTPLAAYQHQQTAAQPTATQTDLLAGLILSSDQFRAIADFCQQVGITFLCTPFDEWAATQLVQGFAVPALKVSSGDLTALPLLEAFARLGIPLWLSSGMATLAEVIEAVATVQAASPLPADQAVSVFHCVSAYPAPLEACNLRAIATLQHTFPTLTIGWSDHSLGDEVSLAAVALGARLIEKHLTLDTTLPGPDHAASLEPLAFKAMVERIRAVESALSGTGEKAPHPSEQDCIQVARRSLVTTRALPVGHVLQATDLTYKRPATGIAPAKLAQVIGETLAHSLPANTVLQWDDLELIQP